MTIDVVVAPDRIDPLHDGPAPLPQPRGPLTTALLAALRRDPHRSLDLRHLAWEGDAGSACGDEDLVIQGTVKGKISLKESLFVEGSGVVEADIETQNVDIAGRVTGNIVATDKVELKQDCRVVGDIKAPRILIADGASFKGNVDMDQKER